MATEDNLRKFIKEIAEKLGYSQNQIDVQPVSTAGANYTSCLFNINISAPDKEDIYLFAKTINLSEDFTDICSSFSQVFKLERLFYTELTSKFERIYNKNNVPEEHRLNIPKCYNDFAIELEGTLVLENLEKKGFTNFDRMKTFDLEYATRAVEQLAMFHAVGIALREENPKYYEEVLAPLEVNFWAPPVQEVLLSQAYKVASEYIDEKYRDRVQKCLKKLEFNELLPRIDDDTTMLIHGDYRPSNFMHRWKNGKMELALLDFQTYRRGSPAADLVYLIIFGSDEEFRTLHFQHLLDLYYTLLGEELGRLKIDVEQVYTRNMYDQHVKDFLPYGLLLALTMIAAVTVDPANAPNLDDDVQNLFKVVPNDLALERIHGVVRDCMRWGVI